MLNSLASYLLGYPGSSSGTATTGAATEGNASVSADVPSVPSVDVRLSAVEADDDWLLVDKTDEDDDYFEGTVASTPAVAVPVASAATRLTLAVSTTSYHWPDSEDATTASAGAALGGGLGAAAGPLEESWFVTPPPCFTSGSVPLETSPLENLLIEHPSMSVYHRSPVSQAASAVTPLSSSVGASPSPPPRAPQGRANLRKLSRANASGSKHATAAAATSESSAPPRTSSAAAATASSSSTNSAERGATAVSPSPAQTATATVQAQGTARRPNAYSPYHQQQQQVVQYRTAQKLVQRAACQQLKRDSMERTNKAREIRSSRNKRQRRSDHMNRHSGANNNRKC